MSIEKTFFVKRSDAIKMLKSRRVTVFEDDCNERLSLLLYENRENETENYSVVDDSEYSAYLPEEFKSYW